MTSCSLIRGYLADGTDGPSIFSFEHHQHTTIDNGGQAFRFAVAHHQANWIDTLHFYTQGKSCNNITFLEALNTKSKTQGVLIIQSDSIVYEKYWGDMTSDRLATVFSVSKSITSLMCGIAIDDGYIHSIDDPVTLYLPELKNKDPMWQKLKIRHLLNMQSGLDFDDTYQLDLKHFKQLKAIAKLNYGHNVMKQIRRLKFRKEPGTEHRYESMTSQILGVVIERASGKSFASYLSEKVWKPLQMESPALINIDSRRHNAVSEEWIRQSTDYDTSNDGYHFNWYNLSSVGSRKARYPGYYALGICAQVLYVNPHKQLICVRIGSDNINPVFVPELFEQLSNCVQFNIPGK